MIRPDEYRSGLSSAWIVAGALRSLPLEAMLEALTTAESAPAGVDLAPYRPRRQSIAEDKELVEALAGAKKKIVELIGPFEPASGDEARVLAGQVAP